MVRALGAWIASPSNDITTKLAAAGIGAVGGGAAAGLAKVSPVASRAFLGGVVGSVVGFGPSMFLSAIISPVGSTGGQKLCCWGACTSISTGVGAIAGATSMFVAKKTAHLA